MRQNDDTTRRTLLMGAGAGGLVTVLAACGGGSAETTAAEQPAAPSAAPGAALTPTADIPVGGGKIFADQKVVVVQPAAGQFKAFTAVCSHRGCTVDAVRDGAIVCPCHDSKFGLADGAVQGGPADKPLDEVAIKVSGDQITLA